MNRYYWKRAFYCAVFLLLSVLLLLRAFESDNSETADNERPLCDIPPPVEQIVIERPSLCRTASIFHCEHCIRDLAVEQQTSSSGTTWSFTPETDGRNYKLTDSQCDVAFPGLFDDLDASVQRKKGNIITKEEFSRHKWPKGSFRVMIHDSEIYIIDHVNPHLNAARSAATLQAIYRAIVTSPEPLPNIEFAFTARDFIDDLAQPIWSYTRTAEDNNTWLMPDFGFWSHGLSDGKASLGSWGNVRRRIQHVEEDYPSFSSKIPKAFWRGETDLSEGLRDKLISQTDGMPWADIKQVRSWNIFDSASIPIHEHCRYMFLIHTEGVSYSARLKYLLNCRSVIFAHTLEWIQPFEYLMVSSGPKQNYVAVSRDFSDLAEKVEYYLAHQDEAERVVSNSVATFRDRYLTPAAEACYWRKLIRGWGEVGLKPDVDDRHALESGTPFEDFVLRNERDFWAPIDPEEEEAMMTEDSERAHL